LYPRNIALDGVLAMIRLWQQPDAAVDDRVLTTKQVFYV
jgi:hypothetical protein